MKPMAAAKAKRLPYALVVWCLFLFSCDGSREAQSPIPDFPVHITIDRMGEGYPLGEILSSFEILAPRTVGEAVGAGGVVVVHGGYGTGSDAFYAYDLACPVEYPGISVVKRYRGDEHEGLILYRCPNCASVYELALGVGNPIAGPARHTLRQYRVVPTLETLYITR